MYCVRCKKDVYGKGNKCPKCNTILIDRSKASSYPYSKTDFISDAILSMVDVVSSGGSTVVDIASDVFSGGGGDFGGGGCSGDW